MMKKQPSKHPPFENYYFDVFFFFSLSVDAVVYLSDKIRTTRKVVAMKGIAIKLEKVDFGVVGLKFIFVRQVNDSIHRKREKKKTSK